MKQNARECNPREHARCHEVDTAVEVDTHGRAAEKRKRVAACVIKCSRRPRQPHERAITPPRTQARQRKYAASSNASALSGRSTCAAGEERNESCAAAQRRRQRRDRGVVRMQFMLLSMTTARWRGRDVGASCRRYVVLVARHAERNEAAAQCRKWQRR